MPNLTTQPPWPFDVWLRLAVLHMHMSAQDFWDLSVRDWFVLCHRQETAPFSRARFNDLMQAFPDVKTNCGKHSCTQNNSASLKEKTDYE